MLCKFPDKLGEPHTVQWYQDFVTHSAPNKDGLWDFWHDVSYGNMDLSGSQVFGWNTLPHNSTYSESRFALWSDCASTATNVNFGRFYGILAILNAPKDSGAVGEGPVLTILNGNPGTWGVVVLDPAGAQDVSWGAHEMGHAFGLNHNYDTALTQWLRADRAEPRRVSTATSMTPWGTRMAGTRFRQALVIVLLVLLPPIS